MIFTNVASGEPPPERPASVWDPVDAPLTELQRLPQHRTQSNSRISGASCWLRFEELGELMQGGHGIAYVAFVVGVVSQDRAEAVDDD